MGRRPTLISFKATLTHTGRFPLSNLTDNEIEINPLKAFEVLKRYTNDVRIKTELSQKVLTQDYLQASVVVMTPQEAPDFFVMWLKCDLHELQMEKVEKAGPNHKPLDVTENWELNQPVKAKFDEIREAVLKEAGRAKPRA